MSETPCSSPRAAISALITPPNSEQKLIDPTPLSHASTLPRGTDSGAATPTPLAATHLPSHDNMAALQPSAPIAAPSSAGAAAAEQQLQVQLLSPNAKAPTKGSAFAAGHDLYSAEDTMIPARGRALVKTDIKISVPDGTYGRVAPRSGSLAYKHGIDTMAGVIDATFLSRLVTESPQLIVERVVMPDVVVVDQLEEPRRGVLGGFGSTGGFGAAAAAATDGTKA
ncbi:unnamed protein product [Alternaria alternata]